MGRVIEIIKHLMNFTVSVPDEYKAEITLELLRINIKRDRILSIILPILSCILLYIDVKIYNAINTAVFYLKSLLWTHVALIIFPIIYLTLIKIFKGRDLSQYFVMFKTLHLVYVAIILALCSFLSIHANLFHQHIFPFYTAIFCTAAFLLLMPVEFIPIYSVSNAIFIIGFIFTETEADRFLQTILFSTLLSIIAIIISYINVTAFINSFLNRKLIQQKSIQVDNMYKMAEEMLKARTDELTEANNKLLNKIKAAHEMEIEIIKTHRMYEEKDRLLTQAVENEKLRTLFFANLSHELKTPLTLIYSSQQMLDLLLKKEKDISSTVEISQYTRIIKQNCLRLLRLISNLIDITKIDAGYFHITPVNSDIVKTVEDITMSVAKYIEDKNIELIFDTDIEEKVMAFDPDKMERIIINLLSNAVKFTPQGGSIFIDLHDLGDKIIVSVKDTGIGIPEDMKDQIFERFVQVDNSMTRNREGSGIGLSLVKSLVEMHNGNISVSSKPGEGSEFTIEIPAVILPSQAYSAESSMVKNSYTVERVNIEFSDIYF